MSAGHSIGEILAFGVGVALSPLAVIAVVLMLATPKAEGPSERLRVPGGVGARRGPG